MQLKVGIRANTFIKGNQRERIVMEKEVDSF